MQAATISPLTTFCIAMPWLKVVSQGDAIRCYFDDAIPGMWVEQRAQEVILREHLPLTAELEIWKSMKTIREISLIVRLVPEEQLVADEAQDDEGLSGGWWDKNEG